MAAMALAWLIACSTPLFGIKLYYGILNHAPMVILAPLLLLNMMAAQLNRRAQPWGRILSFCGPLLALGLYAFVGSSVAKWVRLEKETYLTFGAYLLALPLFIAAVPVFAAQARSWARALLVIAVGFGIASLIGELMKPRGSEVLHEIEYVVLSAFLMLYYAVRSNSLKLLALVMMAAAAVYNQKLTGYIILAMALVHIGSSAGWRRLDPRWRGTYATAAVLGTVALALLLLILYFEFRQYLPSGNADVRLRQYEAAWRQFLASPIYGYAYLQNSGEEFTQAMRVMNIPTHSDLLDLLKHGGLIALGLFAWGYWKIFRLLNAAVVATVGDRLLNAFFVGMRFYQVTALATFAINPLLLKGPYLVIIWGMLGLAAGIAMTVVPHQRRVAR
jgi:hypothetical protein